MSPLTAVRQQEKAPNVNPVQASAPPAKAPGTTLFRQEAVDFQLHEQHWGEVVLLQPVSTRVMTWSVTTAAGVIGLFLCLAEYARKETASGYLKPSLGTAKILAPQQGTIKNVNVAEGQEVREGQELITVETAQIGAGGQDVNLEMLTALKSQKAQLTRQIEAEEQRKASEQARLTAAIRALETQAAHLKAEVAIQAERIKLTQSTLQASAQLAAKGFVADAEHKRRQQELLQLEQTLGSLSEQVAARQGQLTEARFTLEQLPLVMADKIRVLRNEIAATDQRIAEIEGRRAYVIRSPVAGRVSMLQAAPGQVADQRRLQLEIVPTESVLQAEIFIPSRAAGFVRVGQRVRLLYEAFPYQKYGTYDGTIVKLSNTVLTAAEVSAPVKIDQPVYRATVTLERPDIDAGGKKVPLRPDMLVTADIILEKRTLISWLLNPLHGTGKAIEMKSLNEVMASIAEGASPAWSAFKETSLNLGNALVRALSDAREWAERHFSPAREAGPGAGRSTGHS